MTASQMAIITGRSERARRAAAKNAGKNRRKGQGHPATADLVYSQREWEFMSAMDRFKRTTGRQFPTWAEVLRVIDSLGYTRSSVTGTTN